MKKKIGIITLHSTLNIGSILQAQATQIALQKMDHEAVLINYRPETFDRYDEIYCSRNRYTIKDKLLYSFLRAKKNDRLVRKQNFESYISNNLVLSNKTYKCYNDLFSVADDFDIYLSGSDQIWSENVPEIKLSEEDTIKGYFLAFTAKKKISYASSVASMSVEDLSRYSTYLMGYSSLSTREQIGVDRLKAVTGKSVSLVLDPSFLLNQSEWMRFSFEEPIVKEPYVLLYSLRNYKAEKCWENALNVFAKKHNLKIVVLAPYFELPMKKASMLLTTGPSEFLNLFANASVICTDSFHGTAFAINFNKPFYSLGNKYWAKDIRKNSLLEWLNLSNRLLADESGIECVSDYSCDFTEANKIIDIEREKSFLYLKNAIE